METEGLKIPDELTELLKQGGWPQNADEAMQQNIRCLVPSHLVQKIAAEESRIYLLAPPFATVQARYLGGNKFWNDPRGAPGEISFAECVDIADFGLGSDSPILLDYHENYEEPRVIRLKWDSSAEDNHWVLAAKSFREFAELLELSKIRFLKRQPDGRFQQP